MKNLLYFLILAPFLSFCQESIDVSFVKKTNLDFERIVDIDNFGIIYYLNNNTFYKNSSGKIIYYNNIQLGHITSVNTFNPLKIPVFYKNFNSVIVLDNRLAEIFKIDFNKLKTYRNVTHISNGNDNTIWIYNQETQQLELFDFKTQQTRATTLPISSNVLDLKSNYNICWLLTTNYIYKYNYFGSLLYKIENKGYTSLIESNGNIYLQKENELFLLKKETENIVRIRIPKLLINQFLVTNETLYIYDDEFLHEYQLLTN